MISCVYGNILNFSLASQIHYMVQKHAVQTNWTENPPKPIFPLEAPELPSTRMLNLTPLTTPINSSISSQTSAQLCIKFPIDYNGTSHLYPPTKNWPFTFDYHNPHLIHPSWPIPLTNPNGVRIQSAFCQWSFSGQTDRQTDRQTDIQTNGIGDSSIPWPLMLYSSQRVTY